jgi:hypothetical protein
MSKRNAPSAADRDRGVTLIRRLTRGALVGAALLSATFAGLAAASTHVRKAVRVSTTQARRHATAIRVPTPVPSPAPRSVVPTPAAPVQAPTPSSAPPVVSSGGS